MVRFQSPPEALWGLGILVVLFLIRKLAFQKGGEALYFPAARELRALSGPGRRIPLVARGLRWLALAALLAGLCRPVVREKELIAGSRGIDIVLALDISTSMSARDFPPQRIEAAKDVLREFIKKRTHDRMALITFAGEAFVQCPLTTDRPSLSAILDGVTLAPFDQDGTAIGMALACSVNRLREAPATGRVIILLTDGVNNRGELSPLQAADYCRIFQTKIYAVTIGSETETEVLARNPDGAPVWVKAKVEYDEGVMQSLARVTGGRSFSVADENALKTVYADIDRLEKSVRETREVWLDRDLLPFFIVVALLLLLVSFLPAIFQPYSV